MQENNALEKATSTASRREIRRLLGQQLKAHYDDNLTKPLPDDIADLVEQLARRIKKSEEKSE